MRCRAASVGAIVQVVGMALTLNAVAPLAGLLGGLVAGRLSARPGHHAGLLAGAMGLAGLGVSVLVLSLLGTSIPLPPIPLLVAGAVGTIGLAVVGGVAGNRLRQGGVASGFTRGATREN